ncbi:MAG: L-threonylcarbamoyladenylate synthase [Myxococcota bacterium]|jgi:L-threonylcarbamoyladenylate synthase|nr:L-threonylcarbamoyladenylate synthase [Myxococcota bacterium]
MTQDNLDTEIEKAARLLRCGGVVAFPTETVYGLGASAFDPAAAARIFEIKGRPRFDPLIVHLPATDWLERVALEVPPKAALLAEKLWPGPLTLVLRKRDEVPDIVTAGLPTVGVRLPDHDIARRLIEAAGVPVCAPSANPFGYVSPTTAAHVRLQLGDKIDAILDGGPCRVGIESTIVSFEGVSPTLLRHGGVPIETIEAVLGCAIAVARPEDPVAAPGMLKRHYSPSVQVVLFDGEIPASQGPGTGLLLISGRQVPGGFTAVEILSRSGSLSEAARNLFAALRRLDEAGLRVMFVERAPESGLGVAINDRLRRAASR